MKRCVFSFFLFISISANAQWAQHYTGDANQLHDISFLNHLTGFAVGPWNIGGDEACVKTIDGGLNWDTVDVSPAPLNLLCVHALDLANIYVAGSDTAESAIYVSHDIGFSWINISPGNGGFRIRDVEFYSPTFGFATDDNGDLLRTVDGGQVWTATQLFDTIGSNQYYPTYIDVVDSLNIYVGGWDGTFAYGGVIFKSIDGGNNWTAIDIPDDYSQIQAISFLDSQNGFAIGSGWSSIEPVEIYHTADGGSSWDTIPFNVLDEFPLDMLFISTDTGFAVSYTGFIYMSIDGGHTWNTDFDADTGLYSLATAGNRVWACGENGLTIRKDLTSGINDIGDENEVIVYPNPFNESFTIRMQEEGIAKIFSVDGKLLLEKQVMNLEVFNPTLSSGIYLLKIETRERLYSRKIVRN